MSEFKVIDVSYHNGTIDWDKVKASGIYGAILRCGYGKNMESQDDKKFIEYANECTRLNIPFGVYLYSYAKDTASAKSEAEHTLRLIKPYKLSLPVYFDSEQSGTEFVALENAKVFCEAIKGAGYTPGVYASESWWNNYLADLGDTYTKWIAKYGTNDGQPHNKPSISNVDAWQYTSRGTCDGAKSGGLDVSIFYKNFLQNNEVKVTPTPIASPTPVPKDESWKGDKSIYLENDAVKEWQHAMNIGFDTNELSEDGKWGKKSQEFASSHNLYAGQKHNCPTAIKWLRRVLRETYGFSKCDDINKWTDYLTKCVKVFQKNRGLTEDGIAGKNTTYWLLKGDKR